MRVEVERLWIFKFTIWKSLANVVDMVPYKDERVHYQLQQDFSQKIPISQSCVDNMVFDYSFFFGSIF